MALLSEQFVLECSDVFCGRSLSVCFIVRFYSVVSALIVT